MFLRRTTGAVLVILAALAPCATAVEFQKNDRVIFLGNTFAERLRHYSYLETSLSLYYPDLNLTFRNLGWSADEVVLRPRPLNFGDIHQHLTEQKADVIFLFYGSNESFAGKDGLEKFTADYQALITDILGRQYNGHSAPRLVLVPPIPQERMERQPSMTARNADIALYAEAIKSLASGNELEYLDLHTAFVKRFRELRPQTLTMNGVHLNAMGDFALAETVLTLLRARPASPTISIDLKASQMDTDIAGIELLDASPTSAKIRIGNPLTHALTAVRKQSSPLMNAVPTLQITGLSPGRYELQEDGNTYQEWTATDLSKGMYMYFPRPAEPLESIRKKIVHKNKLFFDRWRAVNGYYIYGDRKEPFGVISFPPEMQRFDELIAQEEAEIHKLCNQKWERTFDLVRVGDE